jgi:GntR family transcriptional regulator
MAGPRPLGAQPLYAQVRQRLTARIANGTWPVGKLLPSETEIARELGVSQGTVRKALDDMTADNLLVRQQGRGTFVAGHDEARILFQFFKLVPDGGERVFPESEVSEVRRGEATAGEAARLALAAGAEVIRIRRTRALAGARVISEYICVPAALFAGLDEAEVPNNLYNHFATRFGVTVAGGEERLKAVAASAADAAVLGLAPGAPVLEVDRVAFDISGRRVEWRLSICRTDAMAYVNMLA